MAKNKNFRLERQGVNQDWLGVFVVLSIAAIVAVVVLNTTG